MSNIIKNHGKNNVPSTIVLTFRDHGTKKPYPVKKTLSAQFQRLASQILESPPSRNSNYTHADLSLEMVNVICP